MFGMTLRELALTRRLLAGLVVETFPSLKGQRVGVGNLGELRSAGEWLTLLGLEGVVVNETEELEGNLIKNGLVDLSLDVRGWDPSRSDRRAVRASLHDPSVDREREWPDAREERLDFLAQVLGEIDEARHTLTVFAHATDMPPRTLRQRFQQTTGRVPLDFALFPRELELVDVYVTNAPSIGLVRHFYF